MTLSLIMSVVSALALMAVWRRRRELKLSLNLALMWSVVWIGVAVVFWWPEVTSRLADWLHIGRGADVVVYAAIIILLYITFRLFVRLDTMERSITTLTRQLALRDDENSRPTDHQL